MKSNTNNGNGHWWNCLPKGMLIAILSVLFAGAGTVSGCWVRGMNGTAEANTKEIVKLTEKQNAQDARYGEIIKKLDRLEDKLDRLGGGR